MRAALLAAIDIAQHALALNLADERTHLSVAIHAGADLGLLEDFRHFADEAVIDFLVDHPAGCRAADLAGIQGDGCG